MSAIIAGFVIDAATTERHEYPNEVTDIPVEDGADVSDHSRARPVNLTITGIVSDTPIGPVASQRTANSLPSSDAREHLVKIRDEQEPITVVTSLGTFDSMLITSLVFPRDSKNGDALRFQATFKQVIIVTNERSTVPVLDPKSQRKVNRGKKAAGIPTTNPSQEAVQDLAKAFDSFGTNKTALQRLVGS